MRTERLTLRRLTPQDADAIFDLFSNGEVVKYYDMNPFTRMEHAQQFIKMHDDRYRKGENINWGIELTAERKLIGNIRIYPHDMIPDAAEKMEIGFDLNAKYQGKGYMSEAVRAILTLCFSKVEVLEVHAGTVKDNRDCIRLLEKNAFQFVKELKQIEIFPGKIFDLCFYKLTKNAFIP